MANIISPARSQWTEPEVAGSARLPETMYLRALGGGEYAFTTDYNVDDALVPIAGGGLAVNDAPSNPAALTYLTPDVSAAYTPLPALWDSSELGLLWRLRSAELDSLSVGDAIALWNGLGYNGVGLSGSRPTKQVVNGRSVARFTGSQVIELNVSWPSVGTLYVKYANRTGTYSGLASSAVASGNYAAVTAAPILWKSYVTPSDAIAGIDPGLGTRLVVPWNDSLFAFPVYLDGTHRGDVSGAADISSSYLYTILGRSYNQWLEGDIFEAGMVPRIITPAEIALLDAYLVREYGV